MASNTELITPLSMLYVFLLWAVVFFFISRPCGPPIVLIIYTAYPIIFIFDYIKTPGKIVMRLIAPILLVILMLFLNGTLMVFCD
jgi:hypothetical protein